MVHDDKKYTVSRPDTTARPLKHYIDLYQSTVEPLNNGHKWYLLFIERLSSLRRLKCTSIIEKGTQSLSIDGLSSLRRLKCTSIIEKGTQSVSFIEGLSSLWRLKFQGVFLSEGLLSVFFYLSKGGIRQADSGEQNKSGSERGREIIREFAREIHNAAGQAAEVGRCRPISGGGGGGPTGTKRCHRRPGQAEIGRGSVPTEHREL